MKQKVITIVPGAPEMAEFLAGLLVEKSGEIRTGEYLNIALSGGSTPRQIFENLAAHHRESVPWNQIRFFQVDERCVPPGHEESNFKMLRQALFSKLKIPEDQIFRIQGEKDPMEEALRYGEVIADVLPKEQRRPVFDLILLGLGADGHTASLFPGNFFTLLAEKWCETAVYPETGHQRITLTLPVINSSRSVVFLVTGKEKAEKTAEIIQETEKEIYPASLVNPVNGTLIWLLDSEAAGGLSKQI